MKWLLLVRPKAESDLQAARDWYDLKSPGLGDRFLDEVASALGELALRPEMPRPYFLSFRRVLLRRFPYKIFYQLIGPRVVIFRVLHAKQSHPSNL